MYCMKCGSELPDGATFCASCGQQVNGQRGDTRATKQDGGVANAMGKVVGSAADKLYEATGGSGHAQLKFKDFFTDVFKHHEKGESDELFICGTATTTPDLKDISVEWPKPWVWSRVLAVLLVTLALLYALLTVFNNDLAYPGVIFIGAFAVPFATLIFFFETNIPRNISLVETVTIFFVGGVGSLIVLYLLPESLMNAHGTGDFGPSMVTGFIEETAKAAIVVVVFNLRKKEQSRGRLGRNYILNGLLIGAAVGAGFAVFETAGYIFVALLSEGTISGMTGTLFIRAVLAIGGHVAWAAAEGAALALCEGESGYENNQILNPRFLIVFALCVILHGTWDMEVPFLDTGILAMFCAKQILLIIAVWVIVAVMLNRGLDQVNVLAAEASSTAEPNSKQSAMRNTDETAATDVAMRGSDHDVLQ